MANCQSTIDGTGTVTIPSTSLPLTCKLKNPPAGVSISVVEFFPGGTSYPVTGGLSFSIPAMPKGTTGNLFVRIDGSYHPGTTIYVVEDCTAQSRIMAITDSFSKFASAPLEVI